MTDTKFTPGPWSVGRDSNYPSAFGIIEGPSFAISYVLHATDVTFAMGEQRDRDARLIAASPALYEALVEAREQILSLANARWSEVEASDEEMVGHIDTALALARGAA